MNIGDGVRSLQRVFGSEGAEQTAQKTAKTNASAPGSVAAGSDEAHLSSAATLATTSANEASDVRMEKVAAIQQALAAGTYAVSSMDVAASLMTQMLQR
jgi:negative regulator of flagellin synthesis FlgM